MARPPNSSLLDRLVDLLGDTMSLRKAAALAMLAFVYLFVAKQYLAPLLRRAFIIHFQLKMEESLFWTNMTLFALPLAFIFVTWLILSDLWYLLVEAICLFVAIFIAVGCWGLLFHFPMVEDLGFLRAYSKWVNNSMGFLWSAFAFVLIAILHFRARARFFFPIVPRPAVTVMPAGFNAIPRRQGRVK